LDERASTVQRTTAAIPSRPVARRPRQATETFAVDQALESLVETVVRPLSGDVGQDLALTESRELIFIRNQFNESKRDFGKLQEVGKTVLAEQSKDLWAAWAFVTGLLWSRQFDQTEGFVASCKTMRGLCERYWEKLYPDDKPTLKNTLVVQMARAWSKYLEHYSEGASRQLLKEAHEELVGLQAALMESAKGDTVVEKQNNLTCLREIANVVKTLEVIVNPAAAAAAAAAPAEAPPERPTPPAAASRVEAATPPSHGGPNHPSLTQAFERALARLREGATDAGLREFQETLSSFGELADQVRGRVLLGELYLRAGLPLHAKRVLQYTHEEIEKIKLSEWDPKLCSRLWSNLIQASLRVKEEKSDDNLLGQLFASLCRIDPATAASLEPITKK
jgi:hypothetical protein